MPGRNGSRRPRVRRPESRYFDYDGPVHYLDHGGDPDGPLVVCVHGLGGSAITFDLIAPLLAARCRVYAIDLVGHGRTPALGRSATVGENRRVLDHFLAEVVGEPAILVGNSMGGLLSAFQAAKRPESVAGLVLVSPALPLTGLVLRDLRIVVQFLLLSAPGVGGLGVALWNRLASAERQVARMIRLVAQDPARIPQETLDAAIALAEERRHYPDSAAALVQAARSVVWIVTSPWYAAQLDRVEAPVVLIHGTFDRLVSIRHAAAVATKYESWRFETLDVGHVPMIEEPDLVVATVFDWLFGDAAEAAAAAADARTIDRVIDVTDTRATHGRQ